MEKNKNTHVYEYMRNSEIIKWYYVIIKIDARVHDISTF